MGTLQDKVPGFSGKLAIDIVEQQLNGSISELFDSFDPNPLAAASLGQVQYCSVLVR